MKNLYDSASIARGFHADGVAPANQAGVTRQLAGQSALLMAGNAFTLVVGFPFQIYVANVLGAKDLGAFGLLEVTIQAISALFCLGVGHVAVRFLPEYLAERQTQHIRQLIRMVYAIAVAGSFVALALVILLRTYVLAKFNLNDGYSKEMLLMSVMIPVGTLLGISQQVLRGFFDIRYLVVMSSFLQLSLKIAFTILFFWLGLPLFGYILAVVMSSAICLLGMFVGIGRHLSHLPAGTGEQTPVDSSEWWNYGRTMYGNSLLGIAAAPMERFLLAGTIDLEAVGVLVVIRQLQAFPQIFLRVIIAIVAPMFVATKDRTQLIHLYHLATDWMCRLALPMMLFLLIRGSAVLNAYGSKFSVAGSVALTVLLLAEVVNLGCGPIGNLLNMKGLQSVMFRFNIGCALLTYLGLLALTPILGLIGIAITALLTTVIINIGPLRIARDQLTVPWWSRRYTRWLMPSVIAAGVLVLSKYFMPGDTKWWLCGEFVGCFLAFHATYLVSGVCDEDRELVSMARELLTQFRGAIS